MKTQSEIKKRIETLKQEEGKIKSRLRAVDFEKALALEVYVRRLQEVQAKIDALEWTLSDDA